MQEKKNPVYYQITSKPTTCKNPKCVHLELINLESHSPTPLGRFHQGTNETRVSSNFKTTPCDVININLLSS